MKHVVALSGGKDSTALALALKEKEPRDYEYIYTPTGDELPTMTDHWKQLECLLGPIKSLNPGFTLLELIRDQKMIPNYRARFCTRILKIVPTEAYIKQHKDCILYVGLRHDEPEREGGIYDVEQRFPLREWRWNVFDVRDYLNKNGVTIPRRTDCAMCYYQRIGEWWDLWKDHPEIYTQAEQAEADIGHTFRSPGRDTWPAAIIQLIDDCPESRHGTVEPVRAIYTIPLCQRGEIWAARQERKRDEEAK